jgi:hypothetical protein
VADKYVWLGWFAMVTPMKRYVVKFYKNVVDDSGHKAEICQGECQVDAASTLAAVEQGKRAFRDQARIPHWSLHADRISVAETEYPS